MDNNTESVDEVLSNLVPGFDDYDSKVKMSVAEELVERMPYKTEYTDIDILPDF